MILDAEILKQNCKFNFYYGGNEIILPNWPNDKYMIWSINNDIPVRIPSHPYVLINRSVLCNCGLETESNFLLELLAACFDPDSKLVMYFTVNMAFVNYLDQIDNLTELHEFPILKNMTTFEQTLPVPLNISNFDTSLLTAPKILKDFINQYKCRKKILIWKKGMIT